MRDGDLGGSVEHQGQPDTLDLRAYVAVLRRRKWTAIATTAVVIATALTVTFLQTPRYESFARIVIDEGDGASNDALMRELLLGSRNLETQAELLVSPPVAQRVIESLDLSSSPEDVLEQVGAELITDTQILEVRATSTDPELAARLAQSFADSYLAYRSDQTIDQLVRASEAVTQRQLETQRRLDEIESELAGATAGPDADTLRIEQQRLQNELASIGAQLASLSGSQILAQGGGQIVQPAETPDEPFSPRPARTAILALALGAMLGVGLAFLRDYFDDAVRGDEQARHATGLAVIGHVPTWRAHGVDDRRLVTLVEPASPVAEAYRTLRTNVRFTTVGRALRSVLVVSAQPKEGKTTTAGNLAVALAAGGSRVLLVGADLRRPTIHRAFGIEAAPGLSDVLVDESVLLDAIVDVGVANLRILPSGVTPPNPAELLGSEGMAKLMEDLAGIADVVVYDGPPVLAVADGLELARRVDATLLVASVGETGRHALAHATERLRGVQAEVAGLVLNKLDPTDSYYGYGYYHAYGPEASSRDGRRTAGAPSGVPQVSPERTGGHVG